MTVVEMISRAGFDAGSDVRVILCDQDDQICTETTVDSFLNGGNRLFRDKEVVGVRNESRADLLLVKVLI